MLNSQNRLNPQAPAYPMIRHRYTLFLATCFTYLSWCIGVNHHSILKPAIANSSSQEVAQTRTVEPNETVLQLGNEGAAVIELQKQLQKLGYYQESPDGIYGETTKSAVSEFQKSIDLPADGVADSTTRIRLSSQFQASKPDIQTATAAESSNERGGLYVVVLGAVAIIAALVGGGFFLLKKPRKTKQAVEPTKLQTTGNKRQIPNPDAKNASSQTQTIEYENHGNGYIPSALKLSKPSNGDNHSPVQNSEDDVSVNTTSRLAKVDIVNEFIKDLQGPDHQKRRKAIWELAQRGDSRAVKPLVDLILDSDSQQRILILEALSQICSKTLQPINKALALSLQDENADVRKNAIRDMTRVYDMVGQMSQMLCQAADDPNSEVRETAKWAIDQLVKIRSSEGVNNLPSSHSPSQISPPTSGSRTYLSENQLKRPPR
ncbi:MAG: peptidoglycan-binding protein [Symploca sp. SIO2E9]|nr:peptidoglycan-binding protein [Symploca sp. SIO2E9]